MQTITVTQVTILDPDEGGRCIWYLSAPVSVLGLPIGLRVKVGGVWLEPVGVDEIGGTVTEMHLGYDTTESLVDCQWDIVTTPEGLEEAAEIVVPQSGIILVP